MIIVIIALYAPTWRCPLQWDDKIMIQDSVSLAAPRSISEILTRPYRSVMNDAGEDEYYYRPVSLAVLTAERWAFGTQPLGYRLIQTALHLMCALLLYALLVRLVAGPGAIAGTVHRGAATAGALLFAAAPYGVDTVMLVTSMGDLLVLASSLVALAAGEAYGRVGGPWRLLLLLAASCVAVFSKESGGVLCAMLAAYLFASGIRLKAARGALAIGAAITATLAMIAARRAVLGDSGAFSLTSELVPRAFSGLGAAARYSIFPHPFGLDAEVPSRMLSPEAIAGVAVLALLAVFCVVFRRRRALGFGLVWWLLALVPSLFVVAQNTVLGARYLYVPCAGLACAAAAVCAIQGRRGFVACGGVLAVWLLLSAIRVAAWSDDLNLWSREVELNPGCPRGFVNLAAAYGERGRPDLQEALLRRAAALAETRKDRRMEAIARGGLCEALLRRGSRDEALRECRAALEANSDHVGAWLALGNLHAADGAWDKALRAYREAERRTPNAYRALISVAGAAAALGDLDVALSALDKAAAAAAGSPEELAEIGRRRALVLERGKSVKGDR